MKHNELRSVAHNIAHSLASGIGLLVGVYDSDIFGEAKLSNEKHIKVDFINGTTTGGSPSAKLADTIKRYSEVLPEVCEKQGVSVADFKELSAKFFSDATDRMVSVTVEDMNNKRSVDTYHGYELRHPKVVDDLGRIRTKRN